MLALKKLMVFILVFCILIVVREIVALVLKFINSDFTNTPLSRQITFAVALSYIFTIIFTGFALF